MIASKTARAATNFTFSASALQLQLPVSEAALDPPLVFTWTAIGSGTLPFAVGCNPKSITADNRLGDSTPRTSFHSSAGFMHIKKAKAGAAFNFSAPAHGRHVEQ
jgi:hypothetical protein